MYISAGHLSGAFRYFWSKLAKLAHALLNPQSCIELVIVVKYACKCPKVAALRIVVSL